MATKPKKGFHVPSWATRTTTVEQDTSITIDQPMRARAAAARGEHSELGKTTFGFIVREIGLARTNQRVSTGASFRPTTKWHLYAHSQVSNSPYHDNYPATVIPLNRDDLEWLVTAMLRELTEVR